jgi:hypothetical protein
VAQPPPAPRPGWRRPRLGLPLALPVALAVPVPRRGPGPGGRLSSESLAVFCRFQDRQVAGANLRLASESPLLEQARRIALGDRTPVLLANLGSDRYHPGSLASERPVLVVRWGLLSKVVRSLSPLSQAVTGTGSCAGPCVNLNSCQWVDLYNDHGTAGSGCCAGASSS